MPKIQSKFSVNSYQATTTQIPTLSVSVPVYLTPVCLPPGAVEAPVVAPPAAVPAPVLLAVPAPAPAAGVPAPRPQQEQRAQQRGAQQSSCQQTL